MIKLNHSIVLTLALLAGGIATNAQTKVIQNGGVTTVELNSGFLSALSSLDVTPSPVGNSSLVGSFIDFPIVEGLVDESDLHAEILHSGGLQLKAGETTVDLRDFAIDTTGAQPVITGVIVLDDKIVGRATLFNLETSHAEVTKEGPFLLVRNVQVTLAAGAAATLNSVFDIHALAGGLKIGTASIFASTGKF